MPHHGERDPRPPGNFPEVSEMIPGGQETFPRCRETVPALGKLSERDRRPAALQRRDPPPVRSKPK